MVDLRSRVLHRKAGRCGVGIGTGQRRVVVGIAEGHRAGRRRERIRVCNQGPGRVLDAGRHTVTGDHVATCVLTCHLHGELSIGRDGLWRGCERKLRGRIRTRRRRCGRVVQDPLQGRGQVVLDGADDPVGVVVAGVDAAAVLTLQHLIAAGAPQRVRGGAVAGVAAPKRRCAGRVVGGSGDRVDNPGIAVIRPAHRRGEFLQVAGPVHQHGVRARGEVRRRRVRAAGLPFLAEDLIRRRGKIGGRVAAFRGVVPARSEQVVLPWLQATRLVDRARARAARSAHRRTEALAAVRVRSELDGASVGRADGAPFIGRKS